MTINGQSCSRVLPIKAIGTMVSVCSQFEKVGYASGGRQQFRDDCDDAITMCEAVFWDDDINRCEVLNVV